MARKATAKKKDDPTPSYSGPVAWHVLLTDDGRIRLVLEKVEEPVYSQRSVWADMPPVNAIRLAEVLLANARAKLEDPEEMVIRLNA